MSENNKRMVRVLVCGECKTYEELADFDGPPEYDEDLALAVSKHQHGTGRTKVPHAPATLFKALESEWRKPEVKAETIKQVQNALDPNGTTGLDSAAYEMVDNFRADALECFNRHNRNPACGDYKIPEKRLVPDTRRERLELGLNPRYDARNPGLTKYLCDYCPVKSMVQQVAYKKAGLYDD